MQSNAELELDLANSSIKSVECDQSSASNQNIIESIVSDFNVFKTGNFIKFEIIMQKYSFILFNIIITIEDIKRGSRSRNAELFNRRYFISDSIFRSKR